MDVGWQVHYRHLHLGREQADVALRTRMPNQDDTGAQHDGRPDERLGTAFHVVAIHQHGVGTNAAKSLARLLARHGKLG